MDIVSKFMQSEPIKHLLEAETIAVMTGRLSNNYGGKTLQIVLNEALDQARKEEREEERERIVKWLKEHSKFADPQDPKDDSDKRWEIYYTGYREAVGDFINHLTN